MKHSIQGAVSLNENKVLGGLKKHYVVEEYFRRDGLEEILKNIDSISALIQRIIAVSENRVPWHRPVWGENQESYRSLTDIIKESIFSLISDNKAIPVKFPLRICKLVYSDLVDLSWIRLEYKDILMTFDVREETIWCYPAKFDLMLHTSDESLASLIDSYGGRVIRLLYDERLYEIITPMKDLQRILQGYPDTKITVESSSQGLRIRFSAGDSFDVDALLEEIYQGALQDLNTTKRTG